MVFGSKEINSYLEIIFCVKIKLHVNCTNPNLFLWKKLFISMANGYLISPIDLIPDSNIRLY
jgi:uncharacterized membrane protein YkvA (DUF1232 family)